MYLLSAVSYKILKEQQRVAGKLLKVSRCPVIQRHRNESFALGLFKGILSLDFQNLKETVGKFSLIYVNTVLC